MSHIIQRPKIVSAVFLVMALAAVVLHTTAVAYAGGISLRPPYSGTYRLTSFFDHRYPNYGNDDEITIYTGESVADCSPHCYEGHPGYDWSMVEGTPVLAAADGTVIERWQSTTGYGNSIVIQHTGSYHTLYAHLRATNPFNVVLNQSVRAGDIIGWSGSSGTPSAHLHFGTYIGLFTRATGSERYATDPFGWRGYSPDPLNDPGCPSSGERHTATCLWRSIDEDPLSCADIIIEDAGEGSAIFGFWNVGQRGNGFHTYYRSNTTDNSVQASWVTNRTVPGICKVYAFVPEQPPGDPPPPTKTQQARYSVWSDLGWQLFFVDQSAYTNMWVLLGTFRLPSNTGLVYLTANTGEPTNTRTVMADAIKFRSYLNDLPAVLKNYCEPHYFEQSVNGNFSTGDATGWITSRSNGPDPIVQPYGTGEFGAWLGRYNSNQDTLSQLYCLPPSGPYIWLSYYWWISTAETSTTTVYDRLYVRLRDVDGNLLQTLETLTNLSPKGQWYTSGFDLTGFRGQIIQISFEAENDFSAPTNFWLDNVSVYAAP